MDDFVLEVEHITKHYGSLTAVNNLSFKVKRGSVYGILGPNGSGKSTTLGMVTKVINPSSGSFKWFEQSDNHKLLYRVGALLERPNFYGYMNAEDNLKIVAAIREVSPDTIPEALRFVRLYERRKSKFSTFSFGMQQRLAIASALLGEPEVLILDEPTNGLDPEGIAEIRQMILDIAAGGKTIILASHLLDEVQKVCSHVLILKKGSKVYSGPTEGLAQGLNTYKLRSKDLNQLMETVSTYPRVEKVDMLPDGVMITLSQDEDPANLNAYLMEYGVALSLLQQENTSLESRFIELLKDK